MYEQKRLPQFLKLKALKDHAQRFEAFDDDENVYIQQVSSNNFNLDDMSTTTPNELLRINDPIEIEIPEETILLGYRLIFSYEENGTFYEQGYTITFPEPVEYDLGGIMRIKRFEIGDELDD